MSKDYLTDTDSILTVEARHSSYLRFALKEVAPFEQPFDTPMTIDEVYTLAVAYITSCPSRNLKFPVKAFSTSTLNSTSPMPVEGGTSSPS